ncbi:MAG: aldo/keto reductase [Planctomycetota bacterium]|nr:aldo/keto reductase [Planctomycetota bacterium]
MRSTELGRTGLKISAIGLGGMPMSLDGRPSEEQSVQVIHKALDMGVTFIDTADSYCLNEEDKHHNEKLIAKALASYSGDGSAVVVATKGGLMRPKGDWTRNGDPEHLKKTIRESHAALGGQKPIDLWQYHAPDPNFPLEESLAVAKAAVEEGLITHVGVSNFSVEQIEAARKVLPIVSVQNQHNPWHRNPENDGVLAYCEKEGLSFLPWSPFGGRRRHNTVVSEFDAIAAMAKEKGCSIYQVTIAWLMKKSPCVLPIPGASKVTSIENTLGAIELELSDQEMETLEAGLAK